MRNESEVQGKEGRLGRVGQTVNILEKPGGGPRLFLCFVFKRSVMVKAELKQHQLLGVAVAYKEEISCSRRERTGVRQALGWIPVLDLISFEPNFF